VSDRFGEKLNEAHVARTLHDALDSYGLSASFAMLACDDSLPGPAYVLFIDVAGPDEPLARLAHHVDTELRRSFHYDYARRLGQLGSLRVFRAESASEDYLREAVRSGQRLGDVKTLSLDRRTDWSNILRGHFIAGTQPVS
jgi:GH3 auxin-responsive promoter